MAGKPDVRFFPLDLFKQIDPHTVTREYLNKEAIFAQGEKAHALFYIRSGYVKLSVMSKGGKKAVIAILQGGDFFGEGCIERLSLYTSTATAIESSTIARVKRANLLRVIQRKPAFAKVFIAHLLLRIGRIEEELVDQIFSSSERRLARILLILAGFGPGANPEPILINVSQETLAEMVGTTRSRVSYFMNRFRSLGLIDYNGSLHVHPALLTFLAHD